MKIIGLMACTDSGVIGLNGKVPWRYPEEFKYFQDLTKNQIIIMGSRTFNEMQHLNLLHDRYSIVFTHNNLSLDKSLLNKVSFVRSLDEFHRLDIPNNKKIYMIGGAVLAELFLKNNLLEEFLLTRIHKEYNGDTYFPLFLLQDWKIEKITENKNYTIYRYKQN